MEIDVYRLGKIAAKAGYIAQTTVTASNAYLMFLNANAAVTEAKVPLTGRIAYCSPTYYNFIKQDSTFIKACDMAQKMLAKGQVGEIDGVAIIMVPASYLPTGIAFVITHKSACVAPQKLKDYITHKNPPGINGTLVEGRIIYDAFVLNSKIGAIAAHYHAGTLCAAPTITYVGSSTDTITLASSTGSSTIYYTLDGTDPRDSATVLTYSAPLDTSGWTAGTYRVRAYTYKSGNLNSTVTTSDVAVSAA